MTETPPAPPDLAAIFESLPEPVRACLLTLRRLIFEVAASTPGVGRLEETLRWGEPAFLTSESQSGSTIRIGPIRGEPNGGALFVHCQTDLIQTFRQHYPDQLRYGGKRAILLTADRPLPEQALRHCIALALTYKLRKKPEKRASAVLREGDRRQSEQDRPSINVALIPASRDRG
jgi:hypothetical protein